MKRTPRLYKYKIKLVQKVKENKKKEYRRKKEKQDWKKDIDN